jgi:glucose/arabinose dehydrogenase
VRGRPHRPRGLTWGLPATIAFLVAAAPVPAQEVQLAQFGGQTFSSPYYVTGAPGDPARVFVVEGEGTIRLVKNGMTQGAPFLDISGDVCSSADGCGGESGLFSMAFSPDYPVSGLFYVFYTRDSAVSTEQHYLRIEEFRRSAANPDAADPASRRIVLEIPHLEFTNHNGGQLQFGPDGLLYISAGDGGSAGDPNGNAQNTGTLLGKLLRINPAGTMPGQYSIPADNPFAGATPGADEIYSYGLRNPWRFSFDRLSGDLTIGDVGQAAWEEIDFVPSGAGRGANFGWSCFEGTHVFTSCTALNHTPPVLEYPNPNPGQSAVTGGYVIRDGALPSLLGRYIYADTYDVFGGELRTAQLFGGGSSGDSGLGVFATNVVSFGEDACAHIYVAAIGGTVYRLEPTSGSFPCMPQTSGGDSSGGGGPPTSPPTVIPPPTETPPPETRSPTVTCAGRDATIAGTEVADQLFGTPGADVIVGLGGNDKLSGLAGNDLICGGAGEDKLKGGPGTDSLLGQKGKDKLEGGGGRDLCKGGKGKDAAAKCELEKST